MCLFPLFTVRKLSETLVKWYYISYLMEGTVAKLVLHVDPDPVGEQELDHVDLTNESSVSG